MHRKWGVFATIFVACSGSSAHAVPTYLTFFELKYPTSTLSVRMANEAGSACFICHHLATPGPDGANCYRADILAALQTMTIQEALDAVDGVDSDGDGTPNGEEITAVRTDLPGEVGFAPGLVGPMGTDPCAPDPNEVVSGQLETPPPPTPIPAVSTWGMGIMILMVLVVGTSVLNERRRLQAG